MLGPKGQTSNVAQDIQISIEGDLLTTPKIKVVLMERYVGPLDKTIIDRAEIGDPMSLVTVV